MNKKEHVLLLILVLISVAVDSLISPTPFPEIKNRAPYMLVWILTLG